MRVDSIFFTACLFISHQAEAQDSFKNSSGCVPDGNGTFVGYDYNKVRSKNMTPVIGGRISCVENDAAGYPCSNVDLVSYVPIPTLSRINATVTVNDIWGWTSPTTGIEYALIGLNVGTSFVSLEDHENPIVVGVLPTATTFSPWRDIKVFQNYAFIVSEAFSHGMQVFNLSQIEEVNEFTVFKASAYYTEIGNAHNIIINEDSGYAYIVGGFETVDSCDGGLHMVDINNPMNPSFVGCFSEKGYTHDAQCVIYDGPDTDYSGREICFACNENVVDIVDVTDKENPTYISSCRYKDYFYVHQGWLTQDKTHFLIDDELDEYFGLDNFLGLSKTETMVCDVSDLDKPRMKPLKRARTGAVDHNQYVNGSFVYQSNYRAGLRILDLSCIKFGGVFMREVGYFDIWPEDNDSELNGCWSNYPFFTSGHVIVSGIEQGLYVVKPNIQQERSGTLVEKMLRNFLSDFF